MGITIPAARFTPPPFGAGWDAIFTPGNVVGGAGSVISLLQRYAPIVWFVVSVIPKKDSAVKAASARRTEPPSPPNANLKRLTRIS